MLQNIDVKKLVPHPNNPRKNLGELTELAESIRVNGVLQNLTIVPADISEYKKMVSSKRAYKGNYTVVIGHRRLAAAKLAELAELPCVISEMDGKTQLATMLLENIQRNDLTLYEQAQSFQQLMLDFGETESGISHLTGLSKTTVKRRLNLLSFDKDALEKATLRGAKLEDFDRIMNVKDKKLQNEVLKSVGTNNFEWELKRAAEKEKNEELKKIWIEKLPGLAVEIKNTDSNKYDYYSYASFSGFQMPRDADKVKYFYKIENTGIYLYKKSDKKTAGQSAKDDVSEKERAKRCAGLEEIKERALKLRVDFIRNFKGFSKKADEITRFIAEIFANAVTTNLYVDEDLFFDIMGINTDGEDDETENALVGKVEKCPERVSLSAAYCAIENDASCYNWKGEFSEDLGLLRLYELLKTLGYEMSTEEEQYINGTHELYLKALGN